LIDRTAVAAAVKRLHDSPYMAYVVCTGAGAGVTQLLWSVAGSSRTLIGSEFPYDPRAFADLIGRVPEQYSSSEAAIALAVAGYLKAQRYLIEGGKISMPIASLGLSAAVSTDRTRRGEDKAFLAVRTGTALAAASLQFQRGRLDRDEEGAICDLAGLNCLLWAAGLEQVPFDKATLEAVQSAQLTDRGVLEPEQTILTLDGLTLPALVDADGRLAPMSQLSPDSCVIFPGSFNPLHFGHDLCAQAVGAATGKQVVFELAAANADKPGVDRSELAGRALQMRGRWPVLISEGMPLFIHKARSYGGFGFILGLDTAVRLFDPKYFGDEATRDAVLDEFRRLGVIFYVCNRGEDPLALAMLVSDPRFADLFVPVPFLYPVSSSDIRTATAPDSPAGP
jgi:hypothetical protein